MVLRVAKGGVLMVLRVAEGTNRVTCQSSLARATRIVWLAVSTNIRVLSPSAVTSPLSGSRTNRVRRACTKQRWNDASRAWIAAADGIAEPSWTAEAGVCV